MDKERNRDNDNLIDTHRDRDFLSQQPEEFISEQPNQEEPKKYRDQYAEISQQERNDTKNSQSPQDRDSDGGYDHPSPKRTKNAKSD